MKTKKQNPTCQKNEKHGPSLSWPALEFKEKNRLHEISTKSTRAVCNGFGILIFVHTNVNAEDTSFKVHAHFEEGAPSRRHGSLDLSLGDPIHQSTKVL